MIKTPINLIWYSIILLPFTYVIGIAITELFSFLLILYFFLTNSQIYYFKEKQFIILFIFSMYVCLSAITQIADSDLFVSSIFYFRFIIFSTAILFFFNNFEKDIIEKKNILYLVFAIFFLIFFDTLFQFFFGKNLLGFELFYNRVSSFFGSKLILGSFLFTVFPLFFWLIFFYRFEMKCIENALPLFDNALQCRHPAN